MTRQSAEARARLASMAVSLSFWLGGVSLVILKCLAYFISGSELIKASVFESLGDVMSSAILAVTQMKVRDERDMHLYPTGKKRFTPLGILFFSAFAVSTMISLVIENVEKLFGLSDEEERRLLLRRVFDEQPRLRGGLRPAQLEQLIESYGEEEASDMTHALVVLLFACIVIKSGLLIFCLYAAKHGESEIARTVSMDHRNDILGNSLVLFIVAGSAWCQRTGSGGEWLEKVDPASSMLLALYVLISWLQTASEQLRVLSDRRTEEEHEQAIVAFAEDHLKDSHFQLVQANTYHIGEGFAAKLDLQPKDGTQESPSEVARALDVLENAMLEANLEVREVHARLRPTQAKKHGDMAWVAEYQR
ncbi:unnamed protein product [Effrenium voratum]|uniref:Cation efflux protein transmembrane domain-containing protein n=1 Tax=Effrenium voratum TaxID=2562239 RepID=A0AA36JN38_9DINO|nr:unnamed protein product [Effrenium voratum]CAJ1442358.1 unnamed protein product [Effrenium voratum]CAJ1460864.1 unnamed protein product [Effrenium voratum]